jgi:thiosulfate dehydrogenase (quinone) large subunit
VSTNTVTSVSLANDRFARGAVLVGRLVIAFLWIQNVRWKVPPDFGALAAFTGFAINHPVLPPYTAIVENLILPNIGFFGWVVILAESAIGAFLLVGLFTRLWGLIAVGQGFVIFLSVGLTPEEWPWSYYLMMVGSLLLAGTAAGRVWGLDAVLRPVWLAKKSSWAKWFARAS